MPAPAVREVLSSGALVETRVGFPAMGSTIGLAVRTPPGLAEQARRALEAEMRWFREVERRLTRFDPGSELSRLNRQAGRWCIVSPLLFSALVAARRAWEATGGLFDPAVLPALERWGYDRDYRSLGAAREDDTAPCEALEPEGWPARATRPRARLGAPREPPFELDPAVGAVRLREGMRIDLGGIVKGLAADTCVRRLMRRFPAALADAGGDIAAAARPGLPPWRIALPEELEGAGVRVLRVRRGGVATSATARRWVGPLGPAHHLIDPRTGAPARSGVKTVTVASVSAARAEVLAKAILIAGPREASRLLGHRPPAEAWWLLEGGEVGTCNGRCRFG